MLMNTYFLFSLLFLLLGARAAIGEKECQQKKNQECPLDEICLYQMRTDSQCDALFFLSKNCTINANFKRISIVNSSNKLKMVAHAATGEWKFLLYRVFFITYNCGYWMWDKRSANDSPCNVVIEKLICASLSNPDTNTTTTSTIKVVASITEKVGTLETVPSDVILESTRPKAAGNGSTTPAPRRFSSTTVFQATKGSTAEGFGSSVTNPSDEVPESITRHFRTKGTTEVFTSTTTVMESTEDSTTEAAAVVAGGLSALLIAIIVVSVILVLLLVGGVVFFYLRKRKRTQKPKNQKVGDTLATAEVSMATRNRTKKKLPKVAKYKKMESATIKPEEFKFTGPLKLTSGGKGSMRHAMDGQSEHSIKDPVEFDAGLNEIVQIGTDIEVLEPSASVSHGTDKTAVTTKSEISDKKAKK